MRTLSLRAIQPSPAIKSSPIKKPSPAQPAPRQSADKAAVTKRAKVPARVPSAVIGIDVSSKTLAVTLLRTRVKVPPITRDDIPNTVAGLELLCQWLGEQRVVATKALVCMEVTGVYSQLACYQLHAAGFRVVCEAPLKVHYASMHPVKNDAVDSKYIAEYAIRYYDTLRTWEPTSEVLRQIDQVLVVREGAVRNCTAMRNRRNALKRATVFDVVALESLDRLLLLITAEVSTLDRELKRLLASDPDLSKQSIALCKIQGVKHLLASNLLVYTNGQLGKADPKQLASRLGIAPHEHTSGTSVKRKPRSTRRGNPRIRKLLHLAARSNKKHVPSFEAYWNTKRSQGKPGAIILNNMANKLIKICVAIARSGEEYRKDYKSTPPAIARS